MSVITLPYSMEQDRINQIKANSTHVDDNFNTLLNAVNGKLDLDGTSSPTSDISWNSHKISNLATPTVSGDAATTGYVDTALLTRASVASPIFTGNPQAPTQSATDDSDKIATTGHVKDVLEAMYPVGAVFIGTANTCPMAALFGTWELVESGRALWTGNGSNANTTIAAGLPNATGSFSRTAWVRGESGGSTAVSGAFVSADNRNCSIDGGNGGANSYGTVRLDASRSNSIYGASTTVQPPAYVVNVWRRTA